MRFYLSELNDAPRSSGEDKLIVRPLDECPLADARAVPSGHDVHRVDPVVAIRAYFVTDGRVGELLVDPFYGLTNGGDLCSVVALVRGALVVDVVQVQHEKVVTLT